jgi:pyruvate kinase
MQNDKSSLVIEVRPGERVDIDGGRITVRVEEKVGQKARLRFECSRDIKIQRASTGAAELASKGIQAL